MPHYLQPLINPASIAVFGATQTSGQAGYEVIANLQKGNFPGRIFAVSSEYEDILGVSCYGSLADIQEAVEHVVFTVGDAEIEDCLDEAIGNGVQACTVFSSLQDESTCEVSIKQRLKDKIADSGILLAGVNGMGFINFRDSVWCCSFPTREHKPQGNVALLSQSGASMSGMIDSEERIKLSFAASSGQELNVTIEDYLDYVLEQPETKVVGMFLETSRKPKQFIASLEKAKQKKIPIVALKIGKTEMSAQLAISHSGALAGSDATYQAVFDRYGVQRVDDIDQLATALIMFSQPFEVADGGLVSLHDSGGQRQLMIDLADQLDVPLANLTAETASKLENILAPGLVAVNPLDGWGSGGENSLTTMADCFGQLLADPSAALGAVVHDRAASGKKPQGYIDALENANSTSKKPIFLVGNGRACRLEKSTNDTFNENFPIIDGVSQFLVGARCLINHKKFLEREQVGAVELFSAVVEKWKVRLATLIEKGERSLGETEASKMLSELGLNMVQSIACSSEAQLISTSGRTNYPVVLKTAEAGVGHKSDVGGVVLDLENDQELFQAYREMSKRLGPKAIVLPMIKSAGAEMLLGIAEDDQFGPVVVMGMGGIYTEVLNDVVTLLPPFDSETAKRAVDKLSMRPILDGIRGEPPLDINAYCQAAARLSTFAVEFKDLIKEIDINPVKVMAEGCMGLDALVVLSAKQ